MHFTAYYGSYVTILWLAVILNEHNDAAQIFIFFIFISFL